MEIRFSTILLFIFLTFLILSIYYHFIYSVAGHYASNFIAPMNLYCASKYAITGMTESLRNEISNAKLDVKVTVFKFILHFILKVVVKSS